MNRATLVGNAGRDPEMRTTQDGKRIATFSLATNETWRDRVSGERKERVEWHHIVVFNENLAEICEKYVHKGSKILVEGKIQTRKWTDQAGQERYSTEIVLAQYNGQILLLGDAGGGGSSRENRGSSGSSSETRGSGQRAPAGGGRRMDDLDDDIPF